MDMTDKSWNVSKDFGTELIRLMSLANDAALKGDFKEWYNALGVLFNNASGHKKMNKEKMKVMLSTYLALSQEIYTKENISVKGVGYQYAQEKNIKMKLFDFHRDFIQCMYDADLMFYVNTEEIKAIYKR